MLPQWFDWTDQFTPIDIALWVVGWGMLLVFLAPFLVTASGLRFVRFTAYDSPADQDAVQPNAAEPDYGERYQELADLGFQPAGVVRERLWFYQESIRRTHMIRVLVSDDGLTFAALYRLGPNGPVRVALDTITDSGVLVRTAMPGAGIPECQEDFHRTEVTWRPVAELLDAHKREVEGVACKTGGRAVRVSLAERVEMDEHVETRTLRTIGAGESYKHLGIWVVTFTIAGGGIWSAWNLEGPRVVGLALLVAGAAYAGFTMVILPWLIGLSQWCDVPDASEEAD